MAARKTAASAPAKKTAAATGKSVVLKELCKDLKIEPKAARRTLRKAGLSFHGTKERWVFTPAQAKAAREALAG